MAPTKSQRPAAQAVTDVAAQATALKVLCHRIYSAIGHGPSKINATPDACAERPTGAHCPAGTSTPY
jgi:hypothetical protein